MGRCRWRVTLDVHSGENVQTLAERTCIADSKAGSVAMPHRVSRLRRTSSIAAGAAIGCGTYALLQADLLAPGAKLLWAGLLICLVPSARGLARRIAINGVVALGLLPILWMFGMLRFINHGALAVALVMAGMAVKSIGAPRLSVVARGLVPDVVPADLGLAVSVLGSTAWGWHLLAPDTPRDALAALLPGYDHSGHFDMFLMLWDHGAYISSLPSPADGSAWQYWNYPAGFHAVAASWAQLALGVRPPAAQQAIVSYAHMIALMVVMGTLVATACLISILPKPKLTSLLPSLTLLLTALLWMPGGPVLWRGFENFWLAGALTVCSMFLAARTFLHRTHGLHDLLAVVAAVVGTAFNWAPLLSICWIAPVLVFVGWWRGCVGSRRRRREGYLLCTLSCLIVLRTVVSLYSSTDVDVLLRSRGAIVFPAPAFAALTLVALVGLTTILGVRPSPLGPPEDRRLRSIGIGILTGACTAVLLVTLQEHSVGTIEYYGVKMTLGLLLVAGCWIAGMLAVLLNRLLPEPSGNRFRRLHVPALLLGCLLCTQMFGHMTLHDAEMQTHSPTRDLSGRRLDYHAMAQGILMASLSARGSEAWHAEFVALGRSHCYTAVLPNAWYHAFTETMTTRSAAQNAALDVELYQPKAAVGVLRRSLRDDRSLILVVDPADAVSLRQLLGQRFASRVRG